MIKKTSIICLVGLIIFSCGKESTVNVPAMEKKKGRIYFKGITQRDNSGIVLKSDINDWRFGRKFTSMEDSLFQTYDTMSLSSDTIKVYCAPNPSSGSSINLYHQNMKSGSEMYWVLVDSNFKILRQDYNSYMINTFQQSLTLKSNEYNSGDTLRYYYKIKYKKEYYKGYGDIVVFK